MNCTIFIVFSTTLLEWYTSGELSCNFNCTVLHRKPCDKEHLGGNVAVFLTDKPIHTYWLKRQTHRDVCSTAQLDLASPTRLPVLT